MNFVQMKKIEKLISSIAKNWISCKWKKSNL